MNRQRSSAPSVGRALLALGMAVMLLLSLAAPGFAVRTAWADVTIDTNERGSLTLYKYENAPSSSELGDNPTQEDMEAWIQQNSGSLTPLENVVFSYLKVGEIAQNAVSGEVTIGYSITNETLLRYLQGTSQLQDAFTEGGTTYYTVKSLDAALDALSQTQLESFMDTAGATEMDPTDSDGMTTTGSDALEVGLYLVIETGYPANVVTTTEPFFVSIPMTDSTTTGEEPDTETSYDWIYDVVAYPKNVTEEITIDKSVVEDGDESKDIDGEIGQDKQFIIRADVPAGIRQMESFTITDTLSEGLTFNSSVDPVVRGLKADGTYETLTEGTEYTFSRSGQELTFTFTPSELTTTDGGETVREYIQLEITYTAYLNENAVVGTSYTNDVELEWSTSTSTGSATVTDLPSLTTYAIDLTKIGNGDSGTLLSGVTFELYRGTYEEANRIAVTGSAGSYYVAGNTNPSESNYTLETDASGKIVVKGLEAGTYLLVETGTNEGYNLLEEPIEIVITSNEGTYDQDNSGTFAPIDTSKQYARDNQGTERFVLPDGVRNGAYVNFGTSTVYESSDGGSSWTPVQMYAPQELSYSATVGGEDATMEGGTISITVNNQSGFSLPRTGGEIAPWLLVGGVIVVVAASSIYLVTRKKNDSSTQA